MGSLSSPANMEKIVLALLVCVAFLLLTVDAMPFNAVGPFYNGDMASAPSFDIKEHLWPGLTVKSFTLGGKETFSTEDNLPSNSQHLQIKFCHFHQLKIKLNPFWPKSVLPE